MMGCAAGAAGGLHTLYWSRLKREPSGMLSLPYLPLSSPLARGLQMVVPVPIMELVSSKQMQPWSCTGLPICAVH